MIEVLVERSNKKITTFKYSGHARSAEKGKDLICMAVSVSLQQAEAGLVDYLKLVPKFEKRSGYAKIDLNEFDFNGKEKEAEVIMESMYIFVKQLAAQYPKFIRFIEKEV